MITKINYPNYEDLVRNKTFIEGLRKNGVLLIPKRTFKILGYSLIGLGVVTWFVPFTTLPLIILGCYFLGVSKYHLIEGIRKGFKKRLYLIKRGLY